MQYPVIDLANVGLDFIRVDLITHCSQTTDECGNPIVELFFVGGHREVYGAEAAAPIVAWFTAQAAHFAQVQRSIPPPAYTSAWEERLTRFFVPED